MKHRPGNLAQSKTVRFGQNERPPGVTPRRAFCVGIAGIWWYYEEKKWRFKWGPLNTIKIEGIRRMNILINILAVLSVLGMASYFLPAPNAYADELYHNFMFPIVIGYFLSYIFYLLTVLIPTKHRKKLVRKNLDVIEYEICDSLFHIFDIIFYKNNYQKQIKAGNLKKENIECALKNKCLYLGHDKWDVFTEKLVPIGESLKEASKKAESFIEQILIFNEYLSENEIDILFSVKDKLFKYDFDFDMFKHYAPYKFATQNIAYMSENYYDLYVLYIEVQQIVFKNKLKLKNTI